MNTRYRNESVSFGNLPTEIILSILSFVDPLDIISIRKTCRRTNGITTDRSLWLSLYRPQSDCCPVPYSWSWLLDSSRTTEVTATRLESLVLSIHLTEAKWLSARGYPHLLFTGNTAMQVVDTGYFGTILSIDVLLSRWLVVVHQEGTIALWDLFPNAQGPDFGVGFQWSNRTGTVPICKFKTELQGVCSCTSSVVCMDSSQAAILLAVSSENVTGLIRLNLASGTSPMDNIATFSTPTPAYKVCAIDPHSQTIFFSHSSNLRCLHWSSRSFQKVLLTEEVDEELWNGVIGLKFLTPMHILCMKTRSVEIYLLPDLQKIRLLDDTTSAPAFVENGVLETQAVRHPFGEMTFRGVSFSEPQTVKSADSTVITIAFLTYDVLRGLFHYEVQARLSDSDSDPSSPPMGMTVRLLAAHKMAQIVNTAALLGTDTPTPRSMFSSGARGFVSACVLGPQGKRGVWIERQRGNMDRTVFGFTTMRKLASDGAEESGNDESADSTGALPLHCACLHAVRNSYDLGEDLTHCAFSELTGKVVIGNRRGQLYIL